MAHYQYGIMKLNEFKVNQLMQLYDELEEQVKQSKEEAELLMQAVLRGEVIKGDNYA